MTGLGKGDRTIKKWQVLVSIVDFCSVSLNNQFYPWMEIVKHPFSILKVWHPICNKNLKKWLLRVAGQSVVRNHSKNKAMDDTAHVFLLFFFSEENKYIFFKITFGVLFFLGAALDAVVRKKHGAFAWIGHAS